jgi:hypothetical protein
MATVYTWAVNQMYTVDTPDPGFVCNVLWTLTGDQDGTVASIDGNSTFTVQEGPFTPYNQLTEAQVLGWVQDALGPQGIANFEANVQGQINSILNPPVSPENQPLPWSNP